jgi:RecB family endonuclease NucS
MGKKGNEAVRKKYGNRIFRKAARKSLEKRGLSSMTLEQRKEYMRKVRQGISPIQP